MRLPNGFGNVSKLPGNRRKPYRARITVGWEMNEATGKQKQIFKTIGYYETRTEAVAALGIYSQNPYDIDETKITFKEVFDKWSAEHFSKISDSNVKGYLAAYRSCEVISKMRFIDIRKSHLQGVIDDSGKNYPTMKKIKVLFNQLYKFALQNDLCSKDYSKYVDIMQYKDKNPNKLNRMPFTNSEIETLWLWAEKNDYVTLILIMIYTGIRPGELRDLQKTNVHIDERYFFIEKSKTPSGVRNVPIAQKLVPIFHHWMNKTNDCEYLVCTREGKHFTDRNFRDSYFNQMVQELGLNPEHHPHDTRHTCISLLAAAGVDERIVKKIVGHKGESVTEIVYTHFEMQQLIEAIDKI